MKNIGRIRNFGVASVLLLSIVTGLLPQSASAMTGSGTSGSPYQVTTCTDLQSISSNLSAYYVLANNIDCTATPTWNSGAGFAPITSFTGSLDGQGHTVNGFYIYRPSTSGVALFGYYSNGATIKNIAFTNLNVTGGMYTGAVTGYMTGADTISGISVSGNVAGTYDVGGISGNMQSAATITTSSTTGNVNASSSYAGGIAGGVYNSSISNSYSTAVIGGSSNGAGGIAGDVETTGSGTAGISNSYAAGNVATTSGNAGGLAGISGQGGGAINMTNDFVTSAVTHSFGAAVVDRMVTGTTTFSGVYFDATATGYSTCSGVANTGCNAVNTNGTDGSHFVNTTSAAPLSSWDFTNTWQQTTGLPTLLAAPQPVTPSAPSNFTVSFGVTNTTLSWTTPWNAGSSAINDYTIQYAVNGSGSWTTYSHGASTSTSATIPTSTFTLGTNYVFSVAAVNGSGTGSLTTLVVIDAHTPGTPTGLTASGLNASASLSWTAPTDNGGSPITDYTVQYKPNGGGSWFTFSHTVSTATTQTVTGLTNGTLYLFQIAAVNAAGTGTYSSSASATPVGVPVAPTSLTITAGHLSATLGWTAPSNNGGSAITDYTVQYKLNGAGSWTTFSHSASTATTQTITGLTNGTAYLFQVAAVNANGTGAFVTSTANSLLYTPQAPTGLTLTNGTSQTAQLSWTAPTDTGGSSITNYSIQYQVVGAGSWTTFSHSASTTTSATITGLTNGQSYNFQVAAINGTGTGPYAQVTNGVIGSLPDVPTSLSITSGDASASLSWTAPANTGGSSITDYVVQYQVNGFGEPWVTVPHTPSATTTATITGLTNGITYNFQVAAVTAIGTGSFVTSSPTNIIWTPSAPLNLQAVAGNQSASLSWSDPADGGGDALTDFVIQYQAQGAGSWATFAHGTSPIHSVTITGLTNGTTYLFRVAAVSGAGTGPYGNTATALVAVVPAAPSSLHLSSVAGNILSLSWAAPTDTGGSSVTSYKVYYRQYGSSQWLLAGTATTTAYSFTGLTSGTDYDFEVTAQNAIGEGAALVQTSYSYVAVPAVTTTTTSAASKAGQSTSSLGVTTAGSSTNLNVATPSDVSTLTSAGAVSLNNYSQYMSGQGQPFAVTIGQVFHFTIVNNGVTEHHTATIKSIGNGYVIVTIASTPFDVRIPLGTVQTIQLDGQAVMTISLNGLSTNHADLVFKQVQTIALAQAVPHDSTSSYQSVIAILTLMVIVVGWFALIEWRGNRRLRRQLRSLKP